MDNRSKRFQTRIESLRLRIETLSSIRKLVDLPPSSQISKRQMSVIESQLVTAKTRLFLRLKRAARTYLPKLQSSDSVRHLNEVIGEIELELAKAFTFFDTYMDVLTQRLTPELGPMLAGCDALAWHALNKDHPALSLVEQPLVYCDRGFGASILREGVILPDQSPNPVPLIQIPYSRLKEKYNLTSIIHEVGHEVMIRLGLVKEIPKAFRLALDKVDASDNIKELYALWSAEIGPDFWTFCSTGMAQSASIKEILSLPASYVFRISWVDSHPPAYIRVLLSFEWCRQVWGRGEWDDWEEEWLELYPLRLLPEDTLMILKKARSRIPVIARALLNTRFETLNRKTIPELFNLSAIAPSEIKRRASEANDGIVNLVGLPLPAHLTVFRIMRDKRIINEDEIDKLMTKWLLKIKEQIKY
jgi:hypothetical protein